MHRQKKRVGLQSSELRMSSLPPNLKDVIISALDGIEAVAFRLVVLIIFLIGAYRIVSAEVRRIREKETTGTKSDRRVRALERKLETLIEYIGNTELGRRPGGRL
jgi:hypothetical protein